MGLLDDLKNQADNLQAKEQAGEGGLGQKTDFYNNEIHPRMVEIFDFLKEMTKNLNIIKPETIIEYPILPGGQNQTFRQGDYKVEADNHQQIKEIKLSFKAELEKPITLKVMGEDNAKKQTELLASYKILSQRKDFKDKNYKHTHSDFIIEGPINITIQFVGDVEASSVQLYLGNFDTPGVVKRNLDIKNINQDFLDKLGHYILREDNKLFSLDISEKDKQAIRQMVEKERAKRELEIAEMERLAEEEKEKEKNSRGLRKFFHKDKD